LSKDDDSTLKDQNWRKLSAKEPLLCFSKVQSKLLKQRLKSDVAFLQNHGLMDYSMLIGIEEVFEQEASESFNI